jgi:hypothetical protein
MKKILKFNEMLEAKPEYSFRGLVLGDELNGKYKMTTEGLHAVYKALYNGEDVDGAFEFAEYLTEDNEKYIDFVYQYLSEFIYDKLIDDATERNILQTIFDGEHLNYLDSRNSMFEEFDNNSYDTWVMEVADLIGLGKYFNK